MIIILFFWHKNSHSNSIKNITSIPLFKYKNIISFPAHEVNIMWIHNTDLGRRSPRGDHVLCREHVPSRHIRLSGHAFHHDLLNWHHLCVIWTGGPVVEFRLLHSVVIGLISSGGDHGMHCWWDLIRLKQLFSVPYVTCRCLPNFLVMLIQ